MTTDTITNVQTIQEVKDSTTKGLTYKLTAYITDIYRTPEGLNIFTVTDGKDTFKLTKFLGGKAAFPDVKKDAVATFLFRRKAYEGELQGALIAINDPDPAQAKRLLNIIYEKEWQRYQPKDPRLLCPGDCRKLQETLLKAATLIRKAIYERRPIVVTHHADCDGFAAALQLEDSIKSLIEEVQGDNIRFLNNYYVRNPSRSPYYDVVDATRDISFFKLNMERAHVQPPLILVVDNGSTPQDLLAIRKTKLYGADIIVVDHHDPGPRDEQGFTEVCKEVLVHVNPHLVGLTKDVSASMLCFELAHLVNETTSRKPLPAALGAVADKCVGEAVDFLIIESGKQKEFLEELSLFVDYEIFHSKFNLQASPLYDLIQGPQHLQQGIIDMYRPVYEQAQQEVTQVIKAYHVKQVLNTYTLFSIDGAKTTLWGDYFTIGKFAAILHKLNDTVNNRITMVAAESMIVFRVQQEKPLFDVNELISMLKKELPHARIGGGGHDVAGSIHFVSVARDEVIKHIDEYISSLS